MYGEMGMTHWLARGYKLADRHHGQTGLRDIRENDVADELNSGG